MANYKFLASMGLMTHVALIHLPLTLIFGKKIIYIVNLKIIRWSRCTCIALPVPFPCNTLTEWGREKL